MVANQRVLLMLIQMHMVWNQTQTHLANLSKANGTYQLMLKCNSPDIMLIALLAQFFHAQYNTLHITHSDFQTMQSSPDYDKILQVANRDSCTFTYYYRIPRPERRRQSHQGIWLLCWWILYWTTCISMSLLFKTTTFQKFMTELRNLFFYNMMMHDITFQKNGILSFTAKKKKTPPRISYWLNLLQEVDNKLQSNLIKL